MNEWQGSQLLMTTCRVLLEPSGQKYPGEQGPEQDESLSPGPPKLKQGKGKGDEVRQGRFERLFREDSHRFGWG